MTEPAKIEESKKKEEIEKINETGKMLIRAFSACHSLESYNNSLSGTAEDSQIYQFAQANYLEENRYSCLSSEIFIKERIYFKEKDKKLAVVCEVQNKENLIMENVLDERSASIYC